ncbi:MAG: hypothetical protein ACI8QZ_001022 [Chlamydiales bacterium]
MDQVPSTDIFHVMSTVRSGSRTTRALLLLPLLAASCASLHIERDTATSGRFVSKGFAMTIASIDLPKPAIDIARENASDAKLQNMQVELTRVTPYFGWFDWVFDIIGIRFAKISGTWGYPGP